MIRLYTSAESGDFYHKIDLPTIRQVRNARTYAVRTENGAILVEFHWLDDQNVTAYADQDVCCLMTDSATVSMRCATIDEESGIQELLDFFINLTSTDIFELDRLEDRLEKLEDKLFTDGKPNDSGIDLILQYRKEILHKKRYYEQMELLSDELADLDHTFDFIDRKFDRLYDFILRTQEYVEQVREAYQSQIDIEQNKLDLEQNNIMKVLTVVTTLIMPLTLLTGWYGMNLQMPEFHLKYGYYIIIGVAVAIFTGTLIYFKKKKWL